MPPLKEHPAKGPRANAASESVRKRRFAWSTCPAALLLALAVGAFVDAFASFVLLALALGFCVLQFFRWQGRGKPGLAVLVAGNALILLFMLTASFLCSEAYYRFFYDETDAMGMALVSQAWSVRHFHTNAFGLRDNVEYSTEFTPGQRRVTFVGDSFTAGYGVKNVEDRFVNRIRKLHPDWEVHAVAKPGLDTSTEVDIMHNLTVNSGYELDQVVLVYQINDIGELMPGWVVGYKQMLADRFRQSWICENSYFVNLYYLRWWLSQNEYMRKYYEEVEAAYKGSLWETQKIGLLAFSNMTRIRGGRLMVVTFPYMDNPARFKAVHDQLAAYWRSNNIPHLDLLPFFTNVPTAKLVVNPHDTHPNEHAHGIAAQAIDEFLSRELKTENRK